MSLIIEVIDGVAYAVVKSECTVGCVDCILGKAEQCQHSKACELSGEYHYRRLTQTEREEVTKALGRGME